MARMLENKVSLFLTDWCSPDISGNLLFFCLCASAFLAFMLACQLSTYVLQMFFIMMDFDAQTNSISILPCADNIPGKCGAPSASRV